MTISRKTALGVLATVTLTAGLSACTDSYYRTGYYGTAYNYGYNDCSGRYAASYCSYPTYSGAVVIGGTSYSGLRYRDSSAGREYWLSNRWVRADRG